MKHSIHAVFVIIPLLPKGYFAATTRPGKSNTFGLPGGKVDITDYSTSHIKTLMNTALRESKEEGWIISEIHPKIVYQSIVSGKNTAWLAARSASKLSEYKEMLRITPTAAHISKLLDHYNNKDAFLSYSKQILTNNP